MIEALDRRPGGKRGAALLRKALLKTRELGAGVRIARRHRAPRAGIAPLEVDVADAKAHEILLVRGEKLVFPKRLNAIDRKSTRLNSSHSQISYAVFCLKKKKKSDSSFTHSTKRTV